MMKLNEETGLYENYGIWHIPFWQTTTFYIIIGIVVSLLFIFLLWFIIRKYCIGKGKQNIPTWAVALRKLEELKKQNIATVASGKMFYIATTAILKQYLEQRYGFDLQGKTDTEVINYLKRENASSELVQDIESIFAGSEMIKFANMQAAQEQINNDFECSIAIIKRTIPKVTK